MKIVLPISSSLLQLDISIDEAADGKKHQEPQI
jgi:hypothetical protein